MPVRGVRGLRNKVKRFPRLLEAIIGRRMDDRAEELLGRAQALTPELSRRLILSSKITKRDTRVRKVRVVSFDTPYAIRRHEDFYLEGPITAAKAATQDGQPGRKYLERPYLNMIDEIQQDIGDAVNDVAEVIARRP